MISLRHGFALKAAAAMVMLLAHGAAAEKSKSSAHAHAAFHDAVHHQVKTKDVSGLEKTVLAFAKMGKVTPGMDVFLMQILAITEEMKRDLGRENENLQGPLNQSWYEFLMCNYSRPDDPDYDLSAKNNSHRTCSQNESTTYDAYVQCLNDFNDLNDTSVSNCDLVDLRCQPQPVSCLDNPVQTGSVLPFLQQRYDEFNRSYWLCKNAEDACIESRNRTDEKGRNCTALYNQWQGLITECNTKQGDLERAACGDVPNSACAEYQNCYNTRKAILERNNRSSGDLLNCNGDSYRGILRIECYLNAFNASIAGGVELSDGIDVCKNTSFSGPTFMDPITPIYPPFFNETVPDMINCSYSPYGSNASLQPGTDAWIREYYSDMPSNTTFEACSASNASCCGACSALCPATR